MKLDVDRWLDGVVGYRGATARDAEVPVASAVKALLGFHGVAMVVVALQMAGAPIPAQVSAPLVFLALTFVPGGLGILFLYSDTRLGAKHVLYAYGMGLISVMAIGFVLNVTLPLAGFDRPMARLPIAVGVTAFELLLAAAALVRHRRASVRIRIVPFVSPVPLAFLLLPLSSIVGVELLNRAGTNVLLILVLVAVALVPLAVVSGRLSETWHAFGIWAVSLAILLHKSVWKYSGYSGQPYAIRTWRARRWNPGVTTTDLLSAELLPNGVLYPMYARLSGVHILTQYNFVNPVLVAFLPVAMFVTFRRYTDSYKAFLGASLFAFAHPFFRQYPTGGRAATPVIFLALFAVAISDDDSPPVVASAMGLLSVLGIVVSHYGTSYYVMATFAAAVVILLVLRRLDALLTRVTVGGVFDSVSAFGSRVVDGSRRFTLSLVFFYSVATLTWYMYMNGGKKFDLLPKHARESYKQLIGGSTFSGRTAARLQKNYGTESIQYSKYIYLAIGLLIAFGLLVVLYRQLSNEESGFDDHYYALAAASLGIFGTTVMVRNWGGGRPMMITYVLTAVFAVVGMTALAGFTLKRHRRGLQLFGVILTALFLLNSGVAAALVLGGWAPSNVPNQNQLVETDSPRAVNTIYKETDIATHVWMVNHHEELRVYGDTFANRQTDWYRPDITQRTSGGWIAIEPIAGKPLELSTLDEPGVEPGYVLLLGHNQALGGAWNIQYGPPAASVSDLELPERDKVFTTGESAIYYYNRST